VRIATWNVNGIRARQAQVRDWLARERPDIVCLQEIKASPEQIPPDLVELDGYWCHWHGGPGYSGVSVHVRQDLAPDRPRFIHPAFDFENRIATVDVAGIRMASVYVPNGGKDLAAKLRFMESLIDYSAQAKAAGLPLILCGDINIARADIDVHPKERNVTAIGQLPQERSLFDRLLGCGLVDLARHLHPDDSSLFTWWPPWRNMRARNIGWRIDYLLASEALASRVEACATNREEGTSDHAPVVASLRD
jgi:exodeoxyribonuclease-3